ncbi:MAG TPA: radical SAM protein, partial [Candidatus Eisenbacteria bacterium]|nr:radical SAM protein [Candidatus Eisenbacteria bacterium]
MRGVTRYRMMPARRNKMKGVPMNDVAMIAYGPVPSRRLGQSVGINNIPPKICTYSCVYCQLGNTVNMQIERRQFYEPEQLVEAVRRKVEGAARNNEPIDYLTFVPDGEPTLDVNLGRELVLLKELGIRRAVISNASLISQKQVRDELAEADWVSLKIDAVDRDIWRRIDRPHRGLDLEAILDGIAAFSRSFTGDLTIETMLVRDLNDGEEAIGKTAVFIEGVRPKKCYLSIPTRPPAAGWVRAATEAALTRAYRIFEAHGLDTEYIIGYEGNAFAYTGDVEKDLLSITAV